MSRFVGSIKLVTDARILASPQLCVVIFWGRNGRKYRFQFLHGGLRIGRIPFGDIGRLPRAVPLDDDGIAGLLAGVAGVLDVFDTYDGVEK